MIWIDSSFAVEWLLGTDRAKKVILPQEPLVILPMQYAETTVFFLRTDTDPASVMKALEALEIKQAEKSHLQEAARLYLKARKLKSKASLADAILAAVAGERHEEIASFDQDFSALGFKEKNGIWMAL